jgi:hypothetical protein
MRLSFFFQHFTGISGQYSKIGVEGHKIRMGYVNLVSDYMLLSIKIPTNIQENYKIEV